MSSAIPSESLAEMLHVERRDDAHFVASLEDFWGAPMGADVWARCALAAVHGCPEASWSLSRVSCPAA